MDLNSSNMRHSAQSVGIISFRLLSIRLVRTNLCKFTYSTNKKILTNYRKISLGTWLQVSMCRHTRSVLLNRNQVWCKSVVEFNNHSSLWITLLWHSGGAAPVVGIPELRLAPFWTILKRFGCAFSTTLSQVKPWMSLGIYRLTSKDVYQQILIPKYLWVCTYCA